MKVETSDKYQSLRWSLMGLRDFLIELPHQDADRKISRINAVEEALKLVEKEVRHEIIIRI